jgi:hypothetical protein
VAHADQTGGHRPARRRSRAWADLGIGWNPMTLAAATGPIASSAGRARVSRERQIWERQIMVKAASDYHRWSLVHLIAIRSRARCQAGQPVARYQSRLINSGQADGIPGLTLRDRGELGTTNGPILQKLIA